MFSSIASPRNISQAAVMEERYAGWYAAFMAPSRRRWLHFAGEFSTGCWPPPLKSEGQTEGQIAERPANGERCAAYVCTIRKIKPQIYVYSLRKSSEISRFGVRTNTTELP